MGTAGPGCKRTPSPAHAPGVPETGLCIALLGPAAADPEWLAVRGGAERYATAVPTVQLRMATPAADTLDALRDCLAGLLERRPSAVCVHLTAADVARPAAALEIFARVHRAQCLLVTLGCRIPDEHVYAHVGPDYAEGAETLAAALPRIAGQRHTYLLLHRHGASPLDSTVYERFAATARLQFDLTLLQERNAAALGRPPADLAEEMLATFPHAALLVALDPEAWLRAPVGWDRKLRRLNADFRYATLSSSPALWRDLGTSTAPGPAAALCGPLHGDLGYTAVELAVAAVVSQREPTPDRMIPCEIVTPVDLPAFARRYARAAGGLDISSYLPKSTAADRQQPP